MKLFSLLIALTSLASCQSWLFSRTSTTSQQSKEQSKWNHQLNRIVTTGLLSLGLFSSMDTRIVNADARLNAPSAAGTRVNSDPDSLLRYGLPITNDKEIREIQVAVENIKNDLKGRRTSFALSDVSNVKRLLAQYSPKIVANAPANHKSKLEASLSEMNKLLAPLEAVIQKEVTSGSGSPQEREFLDESFQRQDVLSKELSTAEELLVPDDFKRVIPEEYASLPALQGRAEVEFVVKRPDGSAYDIEGKLYDQVKLKMVIDGYNAPLTGGNFVDLVNKGFYKNKPVSSRVRST
jgi:peptidylprolyl isomerase